MRCSFLSFDLEFLTEGIMWCVENYWRMILRDHPRATFMYTSKGAGRIEGKANIGYTVRPRLFK